MGHFRDKFFGHCHKLSKALLTFHRLLLTLYWPLLTLYCLSNESTGSIQSYMMDGILRIRGRLPKPYQTTTPSRALLSLSGANNVWAIFETNFFGHCHILSKALMTFHRLLLTLYWPLLTLYCLSNESTGSIQSYKCDGILRIRGRLPKPYQTTTPPRALLFERC